MTRTLCGCLVLLSLVCANAFSAEVSEQEQRASIQKGRETAQARHAEREQICRQQFVVTPCLEKARIEKLEAMRVLRAQEVLLDDAQRQHRSQEKSRRIEERQETASTHRQPDPALSTEAAREPRLPKSPKTKLPHAAADSQASDASRAATERQKRDAFNERQRDIDAHRQSVEKRNAERAAKKNVRPLPVPDSPGVAASGASQGASR